MIIISELHITQVPYLSLIADVCPPGCYHLLKMSLLLSLASLGTSESGSRNQGNVYRPHAYL